MNATRLFSVRKIKKTKRSVTEMKKFLTVLTAVMLLCAMAFTMASCGKVDMTELKTTLDDLKTKGDIEIVNSATGDETGSKAILTRYVVSKPGLKNAASGDYLYIIEFANTKLAKLSLEQIKLQLDTEKKEADLQKKINEELVDLGEKTDDVDEVDEVVVKRKGTVVIYGNEDLYDKVFG